MTKAFQKNIRRSITGSMGRYLAILLIIALGVAFLTGLRLTRPVMTATTSAYIEETALFDLRLLSTIGFDDSDIEAVSKVEHVTAAAGSTSTDFIVTQGDEELVYRAHMLTDAVNVPLLAAGNMPTRGDECLVDASRFSEDIIGQKITVEKTDEDCPLAYETYTVTGLAYSPLYLSIERGTTSLGDGSLDAFLLIPPEGFDLEYYTEMYVKLDGTFALYSDEYETFVDDVSATVEDSALNAVETRFDDLVADGEAEIADGEKELAEKKAEAEQELADAKAELDDAAQEIADGEAELADAKAKLDDAKAQLDTGAAQIQPGFSSWQGALDAGWAQYYDGQEQLNSAIAAGQQKLDESYAQLTAGEDAYTEGKAQFDAGKAEYDGYAAQWADGWAQYSAALDAYNQNYADYTAGSEAYETKRAEFEAIRDTLPPETVAQIEAELEQTRITLEETGAALEAGKAQLDENGAQLTAQKEQLDATKAELDASEATLADTRAQLDTGWTQYNDGVAQLKAQQATQQAALADARSALIDFENGIASYEDGRKSYEDGVQSLEEGRAEYEDGRKEYEDGVAEFEAEIADAEAKLDDARKKLDDLDAPELHVLTRDTNTGYVTFESDSQIVEKLSALFPIFFFLIAALVCSTTMTRMVDDERTQIGTLRALGYSRAAVSGKYMLYAGSAATVGCLIGYFGGGYLFPYVIWVAYGMLYHIPGFVSLYDPVLFVISLLASLLCSAGVTFLACRYAMNSTPADLIRPKAPEPGKRILLERITPLWKRLKFLHKVSLRNIFRFKKRMIMMIFGIAGCTALVLTGFGIHDSVANIANYQFDDIQKYDLSVTYSDPLTDASLDAFETAYGSEVETDAAVLMGTGEMEGPKSTKSVYYIVSDDPDITEIIDLHRGDVAVPFPGDGEIVISEKLAELTGVRAGDTVTVSVSDTDKAELKVAALVENYVQNYIYMTGKTYDQAFDDGFEATTLLIRKAEDADEYSLAASLSNDDGVASVSVVTDTRRVIDNMMQSLNYVVALVLASAGALAFVVLFNLGNINLSERVREIATIKVLGFHPRETGAYVFRENAMLSLMGIVVGLPLGILLHVFIMNQIKVDMVSFKYVIAPISYLLTVLFVLFCTVVTDLIMRRKIARIDMAESLKSNE